MGHDWLYSEEQFAAITADLEPAVVVAGAGSGKTAVMAARVVWLVATGQVAPGEVLGLTFTTKATAELQHRIRDSLLHAGLLPERGPRRLDPDEQRGRGGRRGADGRDLPRLRGGAALRARSADRSRARHPVDRGRVALPAGGSRDPAAPRADQPADRQPDPRGALPARARQRDGRAPGLARRGPGLRRRRARPLRRRARRVLGPARRGQAGQGQGRHGRRRDRGDRQAGRAARPRRGLPRAQEPTRADGLLRPDRARRPAGARLSRGRRDRARQVQGGAARRVPGHLRRAGHDAVADLRGRPPGHGGG